MKEAFTLLRVAPHGKSRKNIQKLIKLIQRTYNMVASNQWQKSKKIQNTTFLIGVLPDLNSFLSNLVMRTASCHAIVCAVYLVLSSQIINKSKSLTSI